MAHLSRDRYLWRGEERTRPFAEWQLTYHLHRAGLPVPAPIAARYRRDGITYTGDLITERLADSRLAGAVPAHGALSMLTWISIGRCIRRFHDLGVCHADLNAHNILLSDDETVYLIDFDRCQLRKPGLWCDENLVRLRRSLEKVTYGAAAERFSEADWHGLLDGYRESRATAAAAGAALNGASYALPLHASPLYLAVPLLSLVHAVARLARAQLLAEFRERFGFGRSARPARASGCTPCRSAKCRPRAARRRRCASAIRASRSCHDLHAHRRGARARAVRRLARGALRAVRPAGRRAALLRRACSRGSRSSSRPSCGRISITSAGAARVPLVLASARISPRSVRRYRRLRAPVPRHARAGRRRRGAGGERCRALPRARAPQRQRLMSPATSSSISRCRADIAARGAAAARVLRAGAAGVGRRQHARGRGGGAARGAARSCARAARERCWCWRRATRRASPKSRMARAPRACRFVRRSQMAAPCTPALRGAAARHARRAAGFLCGGGCRLRRRQPGADRRPQPARAGRARHCRS